MAPTQEQPVGGVTTGAAVQAQADVSDSTNSIAKCIRRGRPTSQLIALIQTRPKLLQQRDRSGDLPLHIAVQKEVPLDVIQLLVQCWRQALREKGSVGMVPMHVAAWKSAPEVVKFLYQQWPDALQEKDELGMLPMHRAAAWSPSLDVVRFLYEKFPDALQKMNVDGELPLHLAARSNSSGDVVEFIAEAWREALQTTNRKGELPIDLARNGLFFDRQHIVGSLAKAMIDLHPSILAPDKPRETQSQIGSTSHKNDWSKVEDLMPAIMPSPLASGKPAEAQIGSASDPHKADRSRLKDVVYDISCVPAAVSRDYIESLRSDKVLGKGFFGTVYEGKDSVLGRHFAVKVINTEILAGGTTEDIGKAIQTFKQEQEALSRFRHPNIAALFAYAFPANGEEGAHYLLYELAEKGSLDKFLTSEIGRSRLSLDRRVQIAIDVLTAVQFLHVGSKDAKISSCFHRDIKSANIVIKRDFTAQLIDCGIAKFVKDDNYIATSTGSRGTPGYTCPEYNDGGIPFVAGCDIYSFGVVLTELWTGRLQNYTTESGSMFNFAKNYLKARKGKLRDLKLDYDPFLDLVGAPLPHFVARYADLALQCMAQDIEDRPAGEEVLAELNAILKASSGCESESGLDFTLRGLKPEGEALCSICRSAARAPRKHLCFTCSWRVESRKETNRRIAALEAIVSTFCAEHRVVWNETRQSLARTHKLLGVTHEKIEAMIGVLSHLDVRLNNPVPRLFLLVEAEHPNGWKHPREWLGSQALDKYRLYFVCAATQKTVGPPIKLKVPKEWVRKAAPVIAASLIALQAAAKAGMHVSLDLGGVASVLQIDSRRIEEMLEVVSTILHEGNKGGLLNRLKEKNLSDGDIQQLNGKAYEFLVEKADEQPGWRSSMVPVRIPPSAQVVWVTKEVAQERSYKVVMA